MSRERIRKLIAILFVIESAGFFFIAAAHLGAPLELPGYIQPQWHAALVAGLCGMALVTAAGTAVRRLPDAWRVGVGVQVGCAVAMLVVDNMLAVADATPVYRIAIGVAGAIGILLMTKPAKAALGREVVEGSGRRG